MGREKPPAPPSSSHPGTEHFAAVAYRALPHLKEISMPIPQPVTGRTQIVDQPAPTTNERPSIQSLVRQDLEERERVGIQRYGTPLQAHNGRDALVDAYQEALDLACYVRQAIEERSGGPTMLVLAEVVSERQAQLVRWGEVNFPDGTGRRPGKAISPIARLATEIAAREGAVTWAHLLREEVYQALEEADHVRLRAALVRTAAVATAWIEAIDGRTA
jgi:hypothetical protein